MSSLRRSMFSSALSLSLIYLWWNGKVSKFSWDSFGSLMAHLVIRINLPINLFTLCQSQLKPTKAFKTQAIASDRFIHHLTIKANCINLRTRQHKPNNKSSAKVLSVLEILGGIVKGVKMGVCTKCGFCASCGRWSFAGLGSCIWNLRQQHNDNRI